MENTKETLSSNTLFHFTSSADNLIDVLERGFLPRYCLENFSMFDFGISGIELGISNKEYELELAVPMVCFCDIPLSKVKHHISFYGNYGIGLSKTWGISNGISPILYVDSNSETTKSIQDAILYLSEFPFKQDEELSNAALLRLYRLVRFIKPYSGKFWRKNNYIENVRFYDEREWRFVPDIAPNEDGLFPWVKKDDFLNQMRKATLNKVLSEKFSLQFSADAIRYIIVEEEDHISDIIDALNKKFGKLDPKILKKLSSRVISLSQIIDDF